MLIVSRHVRESVILDETIRLTILHIGRKQVRIGVEALTETPVARTELLGTAAEEQDAGCTPGSEHAAPQSIG